MSSKARLDQIIVGARRRKDMGDVSALAASMRERGLLHPIVVDAGQRLIAGERRLRAARSLGWSWIDIKQLDDLTDAERAAIELEENTRRKDLTAAERSEDIVAKATAAGGVLPKSGKTENGGRPPIGRVAKATVAAAIGVPRQTLQDAEQHVAAIERYPELRGAPQSYALATAKELDSLTEGERESERARMRAEDGLRSRKRRAPAASRSTPMQYASVSVSITESGVLRGARALVELCRIAPDDAAEAVSQDTDAALRDAMRVARRWFDAYETATGDTP